MRRTFVCMLLVTTLVASSALAATEETKQAVIDDGLAWLAAHQIVAGAEGYWPYTSSDGNLASTGSAALAFLEEGYLPGDGSPYDAVVTRALLYIFNRATVDPRFGVETVGYTRYAEDYDNDGVFDDGNDQAIYFEPGVSARRVYTTGIIAPVIYALGEALGRDTVIGMGSPAIAGMTYAEAMQDVVDWFSWGQVEPNFGNFRGGWRYDANYSSADNSTAQWGSLPMLYAVDWSLGVPQYVRDELELWVNYIQHSSGGSGYSYPSEYVNCAKTGGLLLELAAIGAPASDPRVLAAVGFLNSRWNTYPSGTWYGNLNHPYAMWAVYKGLQVYGYLTDFDCGMETIPVGEGIPAAPGGLPICFDAGPTLSAAGDWYSHYCDFLCAQQNPDGSWTGYSYWTGALTVGWYINILNATPVPPPILEVAFDIKPTSCPNPLNTKVFDAPTHENNGKNGVSRKGGVMPVAILGTDDFDVTQIDPATVMLEGVVPLRWNLEDVTTPYTGGEECGCTEEGPDGYMDMTFKFLTAEIVATLGPVVNGDVVPLTISGNLLDGREFTGVDCVWIRADITPPPPPVIADGPVLGPASPNPFNPRTVIEFRLPTAGFVRLSVYDSRGRLLDRLVDGVVESGDHFAEWDAKGLASGIYYYRMEFGDFTNTRKLILVK